MSQDPAATVTINCPQCGNDTDITHSWLQENESFKCACGHVSTMDDSQFASSNRALGELSQLIAGPRSRNPKD